MIIQCLSIEMGACKQIVLNTHAPSCSKNLPSYLLGRANGQTLAPP